MYKIGNELGDSNNSIDFFKLYISMLRIRKFEEKLANLLRIPGEIVCPVHLYIGQEAVASGVCSNLNKTDYVYSTHRSHGHYLAKGGDMNALMAEIYGRSTGCSRGRGGSMHLSSPELGLPGSSAIVGGTISIAVGTALAMSIRKNNEVSIAFFGDGAANEGILYESLNIAALKKLPVVFVCENNLYSTHLHISQCLADTNIAKKAKAFGVKALTVDGNDVLKVYRVAYEAVKNAREGNGPTFVQCNTYRWLGHVGPNDDLDKGLRSRKEWEYWINKCPIRNFEKKLFKNRLLYVEKKNKIIADIDSEIERALLFAKNSPLPENHELGKYVFAE